MILMCEGVLKYLMSDHQSSFLVDQITLIKCVHGARPRLPPARRARFGARADPIHFLLW